MPISNVTVIRSGVLAVLVGLLALLAIVGTTSWLVGRTQDYADTLLAGRRQRAAIVDLRGMLQDAETGQRGYLLTGTESYLKPYEDARARVPAQLAEVRRLIQADPQQAPLADRLSAVISAKLDELDETVNLTKSGRSQDALAIVRNDRGREAMDEARSILGQLVTGTEGRIAANVVDLQGSISALRWVTLVGALVIVAAGAAVVWLLTAYTRQILRTQREIQALNTGLEERVQQRTADLVRANDEIQRFAYIVTHDLRAPLVNVMGFTSELETSLAPLQAFVGQAGSDGATAVPEEVRVAATEDLPEAIGFIRSSTRKMDGLINAILKLSREGRRTLKPERLDLDAILRAAADSVHHQVAEADGEVTIEGRAPAIMSDRLSLEQIFGNLLDNAVKYRAPDREPRIRLTVAGPARGRVTVRVADNGRGIAAQDHERIFDLFRRSGTQDQRGEGIGLAHVRTMVRNLGGEVSVESELGRGTTFTVTLPQNLTQRTGVA